MSIVQVYRYERKKRKEEDGSKWTDPLNRRAVGSGELCPVQTAAPSGNQPAIRFTFRSSPYHSACRSCLSCDVSVLANPSWMPIWFHEHIWVIWVLCFALFFLIACLFEARRVRVGLVRLYQHYAPEKIRRRCLCKPTCSEYAILVLEQEPNVFKALWRIYLRLHKTCKGGFYKIDLP